MRQLLLRTTVCAAGLLSAVWACTSRGDPYDGAGPDADLDVDADGDGDGDADADGDADGDVALDPGPLTFVASEMGLIVDRLCDLDGDGDLDNVFADLGSPTADLAVMAMNAAIIQGYRGEMPRLVHIPWVDDRTGPNDDDLAIISVDGLDSDDPPNPTDDLDGEAFWANPDDLDGCGEPLNFFVGVGLVDGRIDSTGASGQYSVLEGLPPRGLVIQGTVAAGGLSGEVLICTFGTVQDFGGYPGMEEAGDLTLLEIILTGGEAFGVTMIPGSSPDLDLDHDGIETFTLDDAHHVAQCIDGNLTVIEGRDCWQDPRIADGFSLNVRMFGVPAEFLGRLPGWETLVEGTCDDPPETSLFDPR